MRAFRVTVERLLVTSVLVGACFPNGNSSQSDEGRRQADRSVEGETAVANGVRTLASVDTPAVVAYKDPTCGCCRAWVDSLRANGFRVTAIDTQDVASVKRAHGVGDGISSCHTAIVGGYVLEGHVPPADIRRLLRERPAIAGLAVPGMPMGAPGMEGPRRDAYDVLAFDKSGATSVFARH